MKIPVTKSPEFEDAIVENLDWKERSWPRRSKGQGLILVGRANRDAQTLGAVHFVAAIAHHDATLVGHALVNILCFLVEFEQDRVGVGRIHLDDKGQFGKFGLYQRALFQDRANVFGQQIVVFVGRNVVKASKASLLVRQSMLYGALTLFMS